MQLIKETTIIRIGKTTSGYRFTKEVLEPILERITDIPIVYNKDQGFKNYNQDLQVNYFDKLPIIGRVIGNAKIIGNKVVADIELKEEYAHLWKGKPDNWCMGIETDDKLIIAIEKLISFEIF